MKENKRGRILDQARAVARALEKAERRQDAEFFLAEMGRLARQLRTEQKKEGYDAKN
jgi:hypothetical protein